ncbi:MAG: DUF4019 domain-containing protein [Candidatus Omnitrophica bacterium]|nr:DUF4019 domain-containing protein [Candidatus Omnitrophota bacterium]
MKKKWVWAVSGRYLVIYIVILGILTSGRIFAESENAQEAAVAAAETWLQLVDGGEYVKCWEQAAGYFKAIMKQQAWIDSIRPLRESLGKLVARRLIGRQYVTTLPGAPDGEYVVIQFETIFENKELAIETVTPMRDADGLWRVSGYYIKSCMSKLRLKKA